jgi:hypothetical protein
MSKPVRRSIKVKGKTGKPVEGVLVAIAWSTVPFPEIALMTDADGIVSLFLPAGHFRIVANAPDGRSGTADVNGQEGGEEIVITLR